MRLVLLTGKGGVGKTTMAAATAAAVAARGRKVLLVSTDPVHSLADALDASLGPEPVEVEAGLCAMQVDTQRSFEQHWEVVRAYLVRMLGRGGVDSVAAEELTVLPGAQEVLALLAVRDQAADGRWDAVVVDCAPTAQTLRLLALPTALHWYLERLLPRHRRAVRGLGPLLGGAALPEDAVFDAVSRLHAELLGVQAMLADPATTVRLVLTPESVVVAEARRTSTALALYGLPLDSVLANRIIPAGGRDAWRTAWARTQAVQLEQIEQSFPDLPIRRAAYGRVEPVGPAALTELGIDLYAGADPLAVPAGPPPTRVARCPDQHGERFELTVALPHARREELELARSGDELVLTVDGHRRLLALPAVLRHCQVERADLRDGCLVVAFRPDQALWPAAFAAPTTASTTAAAGPTTAAPR